MGPGFVDVPKAVPWLNYLLEVQAVSERVMFKMKCLVVLYLCVFAYARNPSKTNEENLEVAPTNVVAPNITSERQGRYAIPDRYRDEPDQSTRDGRRADKKKTPCKEKNERYAVPGTCDRYIECLNGVAQEKVCPDGLRYDPHVLFNVYPCMYPIDVPCAADASLQQPQPTADCPNQFGYFRTGDASNCRGFRNCVNGIAQDLDCPDGLAYDPETYTCEWPDQVAGCDAEAYLGFECPDEQPTQQEQGPQPSFRFYASPSNCQVYFLCINGRPRRLVCEGVTAFDEATETCISADLVASCPAELQAQAAQARLEELQRQKLLTENPFNRKNWKN